MRRIAIGFVALLTAALFPLGAKAQVAARSSMASVDGFYFRVHTDDCFSACSGFTLGGAAGYNVTNYLGFFGEYQYDRASVNNISAGNNSGHANNFGGAVRVYVYDKGRLVPYGVFGGGGLTAGSTAGPLSNAKYFGGGGGALLYLGSHWGITPEVRYVRDSFGGSSGGDFDFFRVTCGVFYQFGGTKKH